MSARLHQLLGLITDAVSVLDKTCSKNGTTIPDLDEPYYSESEAFRSDPDAECAAKIIGTAAMHLAALVMPPQVVMFGLMGGQWNSGALRVCLESNVTEILREAGPEGMHVNDIADKNGINPQTLGRCLRLLSIHHAYREVKPNVFANTRISSLLDTMKSSKSILAEPELKHDNTNGFPALTSFILDEFFKATAYLWENVSDPKTGKSGNTTDAPIARVLSNGKPLWDFYSQPDQKFRQRRFGIGMRGVFSMLSSNLIMEAFDWGSLPKDSLVVDVGGGIGTVSMALARQYQDLKIVIQDLPSVVANGIQNWELEMPSALKSGHVAFEAHDFFTPQPQTNASVFLLKHILHDWSDEYSTRILKHLRDAAKPDTKLICLDSVLPYSCRVSDTTGESRIPGAATAEAPEPLLPNWGATNGTTYYMDILMLVSVNALERTMGQFEDLFRNTGWRLSAVRRPSGSQSIDLVALEGVPI